MNRNLLCGTALAAVLIANPALAQQQNQDQAMADDTICALNDISDSQVMNDRISQLDTDGDNRITLVEYEECLEREDVSAEDRERLTAEFERMDADADAVLVIAELEAEMQTAMAEADTAVDTEAEAAEVEVQQPTAEVEVEQPAPEVVVEQDDPTVTVEQPEPQVAVEQQQPQVDVTQPEPEVQVTQPEPDVMVEQGQAEVEIQQPEPQVAIDAPAPEVEVTQAQPDVEVQQMQPQVEVDQPEPEVAIEQAQPQVEVETAQPQVRIEQADPEVVIEKVTDVDAEEAEMAAEAEGDMAEETDVAAMDTETEVEAEMTETEMEVAGNIPFADLEGEDAYNRAGAELGEITDVVMEIDTGNLFVVVSAGGWLDIGDTDIVFPYEDVTIVRDRVVIDTTMTEETIEDREDYADERFTEVPEDRIIR
jgi:sporulation protein YlmC with PRC-barrel domain